MVEKVEKERTPISRTGKCKGLSFLELIAVIFIISLVAALVFPVFDGPGGMSERGSASDAKRVASILRYLNDLAISTKEPLHITFDLNNDSISWRSAEGTKSEIFRSLSAVQLPSKGTVSAGQIILFFTPLGAGEDVSVYLRNPNTELKVSLNHLTGRVKIIEGKQ